MRAARIISLPPSRISALPLSNNTTARFVEQVLMGSYVVFNTRTWRGNLSLHAPIIRLHCTETAEVAQRCRLNGVGLETAVGSG
ncbi:MAG: hypothetical protein Kow00122_07090 [Thermoleophilia bacterium]